MRQVWITQAGPPHVLEVLEAPLPSPLPGQVRIAVEAIGVNFADIMGRLGIYADAPKIPFIPGYEVTGRIDAVGRGVDTARIGEAVIALTRFGGYSEAVCVSVEQVLPRPPDMSPEQAAGFPVVFLTAYEALVELGGIRPGAHVLIHAAAGGLGLAAIALAKRFEATIYGTASRQKHDFLRGRGVQHPIDYYHDDFERVVSRLTGGRGVQLALDSIGGRSWAKSYRALAPGGRLVMVGMSSAAPGQRRSLRALLKFAFTTPWLMFNPVRLTSDNKGVAGVNIAKLDTQAARPWMDQVLAWYAAGEVAIHVDRVFKLAEAAAAHRYIQERRNTGKVILVP